MEKFKDSDPPEIVSSGRTNAGFPEYKLWWRTVGYNAPKRYQKMVANLMEWQEKNGPFFTFVKKGKEYKLGKEPIK